MLGTIHVAGLAATFRRVILGSVILGAWLLMPGLRGSGQGNAHAGAIVNVASSWNLSFNAGSSGTATASISNTGDSDAEINSFVLAFLLVPITGSGTLTVDAVAAPASNSLLTQNPPEYVLNEVARLDAPITVTGTDYYDYYPAFGSNTTSYNDLLAAGQTRNLCQLTFSVLEGTAGSWQVYIANQESPQKSFWSKFPSPDSAFSDVPAANGSAVLIGTVQVVPEPGSLALIMAAGGLLAFGQRTRWRTCR